MKYRNFKSRDFCDNYYEIIYKEFRNNSLLLCTSEFQRIDLLQTVSFSTRRNYYHFKLMNKYFIVKLIFLPIKSESP